MNMLNHMSLVLSAIVFVGATCVSRAELAESAEAAKSLAKGAQVPEVTLKTSEGKDFDLKAETTGQRTVLLFYRGGWCPFCNRHLSDVQKVQDDLVALGYRILAISPDAPESLAPFAEKQKLTYTVLSDADMKASDAFGLAFRVDDTTVEKYKEYGIKLTAKHEGDFWLPVPAAYIVDTDGSIAFAYTNQDYKVRASGAQLLTAAREAAGK